MTETERNFLLDELASKTKLLIQMKLDRRAGKYVSRARMDRISSSIRSLQNDLYPPVPGKTNAKEVTA